MRHAPRPIKFVTVPALLALLALTVSSGTVWASTIYTLNGGNAAIVGYPGPYATATVVLNTSTSATITFDALNNGTNQFLLGDGSSAAVNVNATTWTLGPISGTRPAGFTAGAYSDGGSGNVDGWGVFNQTINTFDGYTRSSLQIVFSLTNTSGTWANDASVLTANAGGFFAAAHIFVCASFTCDPAADALATGFAAGGAPGSPQPDVPVPEPTTLLLLGTGLVAAARRFRQS